nr:hypothetical protein CFP56_24553 [Quercus suber]
MLCLYAFADQIMHLVDPSFLAHTKPPKPRRKSWPQITPTLKYAHKRENGQNTSYEKEEPISPSESVRRWLPVLDVREMLVSERHHTWCIAAHAACPYNNSVNMSEAMEMMFVTSGQK